MRNVQEGQLYRDLAPDMTWRDRRLRVTAIEDGGRAVCAIEHDVGGPTSGATTRIHAKNLANPRKFELLEEAAALATDPRYAKLLAALAAVDRPGATLQDYARAAWDTFVPGPRDAVTAPEVR
ncbi:DUF6354 family protein [Streptomyces luteireticuli]|uniref:DUF6354 family protein n=1 Tax=Streptomyces luteireticuli TaxID=173858 RepID=UPI0035589184